MTKYIYFHDTDTISPCENDDDVFNKVAHLRINSPDREWSLFEALDNGEYRIIIRSHDNFLSERKTIAVIICTLILATVFVIFARVLGII